MHSHLAKMLGQCLVESREKKKILQWELAEVMEISAQFLGRIERGEVMIPEPALVKAISFLKISERKITTIYRAASAKKASDLFLSSKKREIS